MKNRATLITIIASLLICASCNKEEKRIPDFLVEFATIIKANSSIAIKLDNEEILTPENPSNLNIEEGNRVILNYTPLESNSIRVNSIQQIFLGEIKTKENPNDIKADPIKIISIWANKNYLNISFEVDYHSKGHSVTLLRAHQSNADTTLYLIYSREDDPAGAPTLRHISFNLDNLEKENFTVSINTYEGKRKFHFDRKEE